VSSKRSLAILKTSNPMPALRRCLARICFAKTLED
jgi:hypothetical protein